MVLKIQQKINGKKKKVSQVALMNYPQLGQMERKRLRLCFPSGNPNNMSLSYKKKPLGTSGKTIKCLIYNSWYSLISFKLVLQLQEVCFNNGANQACRLWTKQNKTKKVHTLKIRVTVLLFYLQGLIDWLVAGEQQETGRGGVEQTTSVYRVSLHRMITSAPCWAPPVCSPPCFI